MSTGKREFRTDRLVSVNTQRVGKIVMGVLNDIQGFTPEEQAASVGCLFVLLCRHFGVHASGVLDVSHNVLERSSAKELRAAIMYVDKEL